MQQRRTTKITLPGAAIALSLAAVVFLLTYLVGPGALPLAAAAAGFASWRSGIGAGILSAAAAIIPAAVFCFPGAGIWTRLVAVLTVAALAAVAIRVAEALWNERVRATWLDRRLTAAREGVHDACIWIGPDGCIEAANQAAAALGGWQSPEELTGKELWSLEPLGRETEIGSAFERALSEGVAQQVDGVFGPRAREVLATVAPTGDGGAVSMMADVTEVRRSERALAESETRLQTITGSVPAMVAYANDDLIYWFSNEAWLKSLGLQLGGIAGKHMEQVHGDDWEQWREPVERVLCGDTVVFEWQRRPSPGAWLMYETRLLPDWDGRRVKGFYALSADVTERKLSARAAEKSSGLLREGERRFRVVFDQALVPMAELDPEGRFLQANPRFSAMVGYSVAELRQMTLVDLCPPRQRLAEALKFSRLAAGDMASYQNAEDRVVRKDGGEVWVSSVVAAVKDDLGKVQTALMVSLDGTGRKRLEADGAAREAGAAAAKADWERMADGFGEVVRGLGAGGQTPAPGEILRVRALAADLGEYARLAAGGPPNAPLPVDLNLVVKRAAAAEGVPLATGKLPQAMGDEEQLELLFEKLLRHIAERQGGRGEVRVGAESRPGEWVVSAGAPGMIIPADERERMFDDLLERPGLVVARRIAEAHGGRMWVEPEAAGGAVLRFTLPG